MSGNVARSTTGRSHGRHAMVVRACAALATLACLTALLLPATAGAATVSYRWAQPSLDFSSQQQLLTSKALKRGAGSTVTRAVFIDSLAQLERYRIDNSSGYGDAPVSQLAALPTGATLADVPADSIYAKAVKLGWISAVGGRFEAGRPVTADEAARGVVGALGLRTSALTFAGRLRGEIGVRKIDWYAKASQVYVRVLGLRYNHLQGSEQLEVSPNEAMSLAHIAYMLRGAATTSDWRLGSLAAYETFDIPALGANQRTVLATGVRMIGQPYVWAGETEGMQAEGHGGFDCSGFVWRTVLNSGVSAAHRRVVNSRTSYGMSDVPRAQRLASARLRPGDVMFWGNRGPRSKPGENYHAGVYMGDGWFIHSSGGNDGVTINRLSGYWLDHFSWGRRVLKRA